MGEYRRILLATDFSVLADKAAAEAVRVARRHDAELHVLHVDVIPLQDPQGFDYPALRDYIRRLDQVSLDTAGEVGVSYAKAVPAVIRAGDEAGGILRYAAEKEMDLIVLGTHGRGRLSELLMGSVAQRVVQEAPVDVLVVGPARGTRAPQAGKPVILAPVAFSAPCAAALGHAAALAARRHAHLIALHAVDPARDDVGVPLPQLEDKARGLLEDFVARASLPVEPEQLLGVGSADTVAFDLAERRHASLIVIAPSSHGRLDRMLLGSVSRRIVRGAPCPVLVHREAASLPHAAKLGAADQAAADTGAR